MNGHDFLRIANGAFAPFLNGLGFSMDAPSISGRHYCASFTGPGHSVVVSFEPGDDALFVFVFTRESGELSDIDDRAKTPRLSDLSNLYMSTVSDDERVANETSFKAIVARDEKEKALLEAAKELRLVFPRYLADQSG